MVVRPLASSWPDQERYHYQLVRANADVLSLIQLGLTLMGSDGEARPGVCTWQFHFRFSLA